MREATSNQEWHPIARKRLYEQVAHKVEKMILTQMKPGDRLPTERDLARMLRVSRCSLRDALLRLEMLGLIGSRQGWGTVVLEAGASRLVPPLANVIAHHRSLIQELLDFRKVLEPPLAARAAQNATPGDLDALEEILARQAEKIRNGHDGIEEDSEFHYAIAGAAQNTVMPQVLDVIMDMLRESRASSLQTKGRRMKSLSGHRRIIAAIKHRNPAAAANAMTQHIGEIERILRTGIACRPPGRH